MDKATFFKARPKTETVEIPDLGSVTVRGLTSAEWDRYEGHCNRTEGDRSTFQADRALLIRMGCLDPQFDDSDMIELGNLTSAVANPLAKAIMSLCGATKESAEAAEKNS